MIDVHHRGSLVRFGSVRFVNEWNGATVASRLSISLVARDLLCLFGSVSIGNISYSACLVGTVLGAIRGHGFILMGFDLIIGNFL